MSNIIIVDENDTPIGVKPYGELWAGEIYRVSALWLTDATSGDILITQRKMTMPSDPGKWMGAVSGTVDEGETYQQNMVKEIGEEIGLYGLILSEDIKEFVQKGDRRYFVQWFNASVNKDNVTITIQEDEVEAYRWISAADLVRDVTAHPETYVPTMANALKRRGLLPAN
jgi:isopentenyldiphosphate isomerase